MATGFEPLTREGFDEGMQKLSENKIIYPFDENINKLLLKAYRIRMKLKQHKHTLKSKVISNTCLDIKKL